MKTAAAVWFFIGLLLILHISTAQKSGDDSVHSSHVVVFSVSTQVLVSLLLLGLTVVLSGIIYLWILRYVCIGCCQPVAVSIQSDLSVMA